MGSKDLAEEQAAASHRLALEAGEPTDRMALLSAHQLQSMMLANGKYQEGLELGRQQLEICLKAFGPDNSKTRRMREDVATALKMLGDYPQAAAELEKLYVSYRDAGDAGDASDSSTQATCTIGENYGSTLVHAGDPGRGAEVLREVLNIRTASGDVINAASTQVELGRALIASGRYEEAEPELLASYNTLAERRGEEHTDTIGALSILGMLYGSWERWEQALPWSRKSYQLRLARSGPDHINSSYGRIQLAQILIEVGEFAEARELLDEAIRRMGDHKGRYFAHVGLARLDHVQGRYREAIERLDDILERRIADYGMDSGDARETRMELARSLIELGRFEEADAHLTQALDGLDDSDLGVDFRLSVQLHRVLAARALGHDEEAQALLSDAERTIASRERIKPSTQDALDRVQSTSD